MVPHAMAKKKKTSTAIPSDGVTAAATPSKPVALLDFEARFEAGDANGARALALAALSGGAQGDTADRARILLSKVNLDGPPFVVFGAMLLVLTVAFFTLIVGRNVDLQHAQPLVDLNKAAIRVTPATPEPAPLPQGGVPQDSPAPPVTP